MLPGFRFLFAAILLSTSVLVFGLGAAALLRASHEEYVNNPSWRNGPQEQVFAQSSAPVLAALRAEPEPAADEATPSLRDQVPSIAMPAVEAKPEQMAAVTLETNAQPPQQVADAAPTAVAPPAAEAPAAESARTETAPAAPADTLTPADTKAALPEDKPAPVAAVAEAQPPQTTAALASPASDSATAKLAALNEPATTTVKDAPALAKADTSTPESKATKPRAHKKKRHRIVRRPPPPPVQQQTYYYPFMQPQPTLAATPTRSRQ
ncbi:hypothetical protein [Bradyrhizobium sp. Cp5.3]|uniref:hypothetical protein n=1 Tax=Bradyrhizobium sp. Cp5.3 TaxID=443598 RepID=UPI000421C804|nr:hypothetical protein [Bradyrhizobium sp. Cp5.3]